MSRSEAEREALRAEAQELHEAEARDLRLELDRLTHAEKTLEGMAVVEPGEARRLRLVQEAIRERISRLADLEAGR